LGEIHASDAVFYPVFLDLRGRRCLVVGAGNVAARKAQSLLEAGAMVRVVSPEACEQVQELYAAGRLEWERRGFEETDLEGCYLVIGATGNPAVNRRVFDAAERAGMPANIVDVPELCNFIVPSCCAGAIFR